MSQNISVNSISELQGLYVSGDSDYDALANGDLCFIVNSTDYIVMPYMYYESSGATHDGVGIVAPTYLEEGVSYTGNGRWLKSEWAGPLVLPAASGGWSGRPTLITAGESLAFGDLICQSNTTGSTPIYKKANATALLVGNEYLMPATHIVVSSSISSEGTGLAITHGYVRNSSWSLGIGRPIYASITAGALSNSAPTVTGNLMQRVGIGLTAEILFFNPSLDTFTIQSVGS